MPVGQIPANKRIFSEDERRSIAAEYIDGATIIALANKYRSHHDPIKKVIVDAGVKPRPNGSKPGPLHPSWTGGRVRHGKYWKVSVSPEHPMFSMAQSRNGYRYRYYVLEHRLVMANHLGRPLLASEDVHHKNGDTSDNSIENLELWSTDHPKGQRVEDLVEFAERILARYKAVV